jgi:hypothetical protein
MSVHYLTNQIFPQSKGAIKFLFYDVVRLTVIHISTSKQTRVISSAAAPFTSDINWISSSNFD